MVPLAAPTADNAIMPLMDPAFAAAVCRYDLSAGAIKLNAPLSQAYTSVTFYTRNSVAYYAIDDRAAGRRAIELDLMTPEQHAQVPEGEDVTAADRLLTELSQQIAANEVQVVAAPRFAYASAPAVVITQPR